MSADGKELEGHRIRDDYHISIAYSPFPPSVHDKFDLRCVHIRVLHTMTTDVHNLYDVSSQSAYREIRSVSMT